MLVHQRVCMHHFLVTHAGSKLLGTRRSARTMWACVRRTSHCRLWAAGVVCVVSQKGGLFGSIPSQISQQSKDFPERSISPNWRFLLKTALLHQKETKSQRQTHTSWKNPWYRTLWICMKHAMCSSPQYVIGFWTPGGPKKRKTIMGWQGAKWKVNPAVRCFPLVIVVRRVLSRLSILPRLHPATQKFKF